MDIERMYDNLVSLGFEEAFNALWLSLSDLEKEENYKYIARMYELEESED